MAKKLTRQLREQGLLPYLAAGTLALLLTANVQADMLYSLDWDGNYVPLTTYDANAVRIQTAPNVTGSTATDIEDSTTLYRFQNNDANAIGWLPTSLAADNNITPIDSSDELNNNAYYYEITINADANLLLDLDSLTFKIRRASSSDGEGRKMELFYAINGDSFVFGNTPGFDVTPTLGRSSAPSGQDRMIDLSVLDPVQSITFRFYSTTAGAPETADITLSGTVVPEPSTLVLSSLGLLGLGFVVLRRRVTKT